MNTIDRPTARLARNVRRLGHLDLAGGGQVTVSGSHAFVGHIPNPDHLGTSIIDIADPRKPRLVATITLDDHESHSHKVRVAGDIMVVNHERNMSKMGRRAEELPAVRRALTQALGREPTRKELAAKMGVSEDDLTTLEDFERRGYHNGGFKIYDVSNPAQPKLVCYQKTGGIGVHRFDMDERHAYISTEMQGYVGNILVIYDLRDPVRPQEVSRWWMPGQHVAGGEAPTWSGRRHRLHHALRFGDEMWASCWHGGFWVVDVSDLARPKSIGNYNYHPLFPEPTHTVLPLPGRIEGRRIAVAIDEEDQALSAGEEEARRGRAHACLLTFDVSDLAAIKPLAQFQVSELELAVQPHARRPLRRASVLRTRDRYGRPCRLVRRRVADHRRRRSAEAPRARLFHPRARRGQTRAAEQRRRARRAWADLRDRSARRLRYFAV